MSKILHIISSPRGEASNSIKLANAVIDQLRMKDPGAAVHVKDLTRSPFPHLEEAHLNAFFTPAEKHTAENKAAISHSDQAIAELFDADIIVIGAPMYNFSVSSTLKAWIDHVARAGITFKYTDHGPEGLISGKKVYLAVTTGGIYSSGDYAAVDFLTPYLKFMLGFIGLDDVTVFRAEGFALSGVQDTALDKGIDSVKI
ncbi:FMN-dependent NADH-azoreductase [Mucilaginibacter phyllosphaerae]